MSDSTEPSNVDTSKSTKFLSVKEAATVSSYTTAHVTRLAQKGLITAVRDGRQWLIDPISLQKFVWDTEEKKKVRKEQLRKERVEELHLSSTGQTLEDSDEEFSIFDVRTAVVSAVFTTCVALLFSLGSVYDQNEQIFAGSTVVSGVERLSYDFKDRVLPRTRDLSATTLLSAPIATYSGKVLESLWCDLKLLWYKNDSCGAPAIEYAILPIINNRDADPETNVTVNNTYITNPVEREVVEREIVREVFVQDGQLSFASYITRTEYDNQVDAIMRSIENIDTSGGGGGTSNVASLEDLSDVAAMTESTGDLLIWTGSTWSNIATSSLGISGGSGAVDSVNGQTGVVVLDTGDVSENGNLYFTNARARESLSSSATGLSYATSTGVFSLTAGYTIPLTASTTEWSNTTNLVTAGSASWDAAAASTTALTPSYLRGLFSNSATGLTYDSGTGATSLTSGYTIPLLASTTEWVTAYGWGDHSLQNYIQQNDNVVFGNATTTSLVVSNNITTSLNDGCVEVAGGILTSTGSNCGIGSGGITSLNGLTTSSQSFATSTSGGLDLSITSSSGVHTFTAGLSAGYTIPLSASTTEWANTRNIVNASSTLWDTAYSWGDHSTAGYLTTIASSTIRNMFSNTATGLTYDSGTGITSLTAGYTIPLTASTTEWSTTYGWGDHSIAGYLTEVATTTVRSMFSTGTGLSYSTTTGEFINTGVLSLGGLTGAVATSSLHVSTSTYAFTSGTSSIALSLDGFNSTDYLTLSAWYATTTDALDEGLNNLYFTNARARESLSSSATGLSYATSTGAFSLTAGYTIPLTASTTEWSNTANLVTAGSASWDAAAASTTALTPAYLRGLFSNSATGLTYDSGTGATSLTAGYTIPLTASTTEWATAYGWGDHSAVGYLVSGDIDTSSELLTIVSDETGTGSLVFNASPTFTGNTTLANASTTNLTVSGNSYLGTVASGTWNGTDIDISDYTNLSVTATGLSLSGDAVALTAGYIIPLSASTTEWSTAYGWGDHSIAGYLTNITGESLEDLTDVATMTKSTGDLLSWNGSSWTNVATSSLGFNDHDSVTLAGENYLSLATQQITANAINPDNLASADFGDFTCNGTTCSFDTDSVSDNEIDYTTVTLNDLTFDVGNVSKTEFGYLDGVTSAIQTQLDSKLSTTTAASTYLTINNNLSDLASTTVARTNLGLGTVALLNSIDISDNTNLSVSATGLSLSGDAVALTAGYTIPLSASTTEWSTAYGWGDHSIAGYLTNITGESFYDLVDTQSSYTANRVLYQGGGGVTDSANLTFDGSLFSVIGTASSTNLFTTNATTTNITASGHATLATASSTNFTVSGNSYIGTVLGGAWQGSAIGVQYGGTGASTFTAGEILVGNGTGAITSTSTANLKATLGLNNVENTALSTWAGSSNITTLGTIVSGVWNGTTIDVAHGGTGATTLTGLLLGNGTGAFTATTTLSSSYIEDAYVLNTGDSISGNLTFSGLAANIVLGSNWLSGDGGDEGLFVDSVGKVGIGTASPTAALSITNDGTSDLDVLLDNGTVQGVFELQSNSVARLGTITNHSFEFVTNNSTRFKVTNAGNIGIGSTSPSSKLTVQGDTWIGGNITATGTLNITDHSTLTTASTTNLTVSGNSYLGTVASGTWNGTDIDISDYTNLSVSATGLELSGDAIALTAGYTIPLTASTTAWNTAYSWGDHSIAGYLTNITGESLEDLTDVAAMTKSTGDLLSWNGSSWTNVATSSLGITGTSDGVASSSVAFSVHKNGTNQTVTANTFTLLTWSTEVFDTNNNFDLTTERFTPTVAGKYIATVASFCNDSTTNCQVAIYKNGVLYSKNVNVDPNNTGSMVTTIVDMNGTTDYLEAYGYDGGGTTISGAAEVTYFSGALIAPANGLAGGWSNDGTQSYLADYTDLVAIGTSTAAAKLDVWGSAGSTDILGISSSTGSRLLTVTSNGNVGIGTTTPSSKLSVYGDVLLEGSSRYLNFGSTAGTSGYGIRDNAGTIEFKNSGGSWTGIGTGTGSTGSSSVAFSVHKNSTAQTVTSATVTLLTWSTELFDTNNNFDLTTERFTPTVAGKYTVTLSAFCDNGTTGCAVYIYKNNVLVNQGYTGSNVATGVAAVTAIIDMNGTTDYLEAYVFNNNGTTINGGKHVTYFSGALIAPANGLAGGWSNDGTQSYLADYTDLVAIGTTTAAAKLDVWGSAGSTDILGISSSTGSRLLTLTSGGNLGLGTTTPSSKLSIQGTGNLLSLFDTAGNSIFNIASATTSTSTLATNLAITGNLSLSGSLYDSTSSAGSSGMVLQSTGSGTQWVATSSLGITGGTDGVASSSVAFSVHKNGTNQTVTSNVETLVTWSTEDFDTNNNFDLSTERFTPTIAGKYIVTVAVRCDSATTFCQARLRKNGSGISTRYEYTAGGGTPPTTVTATVDMNGTTDYLDVMATNSGGTTINGGAEYTYFSGALIAPANGLAGGWSNDGTQSYLADYTDLVAIGTTTATAKLDIWGSAGSTDILGISSSTGSRLLTVTSNGNLGIGTSSPTYKLDVAGGYINVDGNSGGYKISGNTILQASSTNFSTLVGNGAGTVLQATGLYNTAVGYQSLNVATSSTYNTAVGYQSLFSDTSGGSNTATGYKALYSNTTGGFNTALGRESLYSNTTGVANTAYGYKSLYSNTTGSYNVASAYQALQSNTTGSYNMALGRQALYSNTSGQGNTAVGFRTGYGDGSTLNQQSVVDEYITLIGYQASRDASVASTTSLTNSVAIGYNARFLASNQVVLGNDSVTSTLLKGNVSIGTTTNAVAGGTAAFLNIDRSSAGAFAVGTYINLTTSASHFGFANPNGLVGTINTSASATTYNTTSDRRTKENITETVLGLDALMQLPIRDFSFIKDTTHATTSGFIAQELYEIFPWAVSTNGDNGIDPLTGTSTPWSVDYGRVTPLIARAVQELNLKLEDLATTSLYADLEADSFTKSFFDKLIAWFADATNGIENFFANRVSTKELCVGDGSGAETCITKSQLDSLLQSAAVGSSNSGGEGGGSSTPEPLPPVDTTTPEPTTNDTAATTTTDVTTDTTTTTDGTTDTPSPDNGTITDTEPVPEPTPEPAPDPEPESAPEPAPEPTPEPTPTPAPTE